MSNGSLTFHDGSTDSVPPPLLVPIKKESPPTPLKDSRSLKDDNTDTSSQHSDDVVSTSGSRKNSRTTHSSSLVSEDSENITLDWDPAMAQLLYESSVDAVVLINETGVIKSLNMSAQHMFGYFTKEIVHQNFSTLLPKHYRKQFNAKLTDFFQKTRPGDMEEFRDGMCERKSGDTFDVSIRVVNNLASTSMEPGLIITIHDESDFMNLQSRSQRRVKELQQQVEAKEAMLMKAQAQEERELLQAQKLKEAQITERKIKKKEFNQQIKEINDMKQQMIEQHETELEELNSTDNHLREQIEVAKETGNDNAIHKLELERLRLLFKREAQDLLLRQKIQSEEAKINHIRLANDKAEKQLKEAQQQKMTALREAHTLRRFRKEQRSITKAQKIRQLSELRENQIEEQEALKRRHRQELFTLSNEMRKTSRKLKYDQEKLAAELLEQQTKYAAEVQLVQQKEAQSLVKMKERELETIRVEQELAANLLKKNQEEILKMLAGRHEDEQKRFGQQLEEKKHYELLAQNCSDMISLHNVDTLSCRYVSPSCESLLGYSQEEMAHINYHDLVVTENRNEAREAVRRLLEIARSGSRELPSCQQVFRMRRKDGSNLWVERAVKVFWSRTTIPKRESKTKAITASGELNGITEQVLAITAEDEFREEMELLFTTRNITQRKDMEEHQRRGERLQAAATTASQVKRDFLAFIGHECRNPLNALFNVTDFLTDTGLSDQQSQYVGIIKQCCGDMLRILNDLLDLSRIEAGKIEVELLPFNVRAVISDAVTTMHAQASKKGLDVTSYIEPAVPKMVVGDATRIRQILLNMISNGIKFTEKGKIHCSLAVHDEIDENIFLLFKVIDTGIGIDEDVVSKLFTMYGQASVSDYRKYGGSGIGLRLCALLVQQSMGGNIGIESVKGEGTTVWFTVPFGRKVPADHQDNSYDSNPPHPSSTLAIENVPNGEAPSHSTHTPSTSASNSTSTTTHTSPNAPHENGLHKAATSPKIRADQQLHRADQHPPTKTSPEPRSTPAFIDSAQYDVWTSKTPLLDARSPSIPTTPMQQAPPALSLSPKQTRANQPAPLSVQVPQTPQPAQPMQQPIQTPTPQQVQKPTQTTPVPTPTPTPQKPSPDKSTHHTPATPPSGSVPPTPTTPLPTTPSSGSKDEKPMTVLVVDDIPLNRDIAVALLSKENCKCDVAVDGVEAVAAFKQKPYDLILLDIQMPRMTGTEAIYYIREHEKNEGLRRVPVVAISGNVQPSEQASYFQSGMDGFLAKPFKRDEFLRMLNKYKPRPDSDPKTPPAAQATPAAAAAPQQRTVPAGSQSVGALRSPPQTREATQQPQTAPAQQPRPKPLATSPVAFKATYSDPSFLTTKNTDPSFETPQTNRRLSVSAVSSPYNLIPLSNLGMPSIQEEPSPTSLLPTTPLYSTTNTSSSTTTTTSSYPHTPSVPTPSSSSLRRSSSPLNPDIVFPSPHPAALTTSPTSLRVHSPEREYKLEQVTGDEHYHNVRILVADNSHADRQIYKRMLAQYQADIVSSGTDALDLFDTNSYDVILLDCNLEDLGIRDVVDQIRRKEQLSNQHVPIVLVCTTAKQEEEFRSVGVSQILIKGRGFINRDILMQALLRSVNIVPGDKPFAVPQAKDLFDTSELVDSLFLAQISRSNFFSELFQLFIGCTERIVVQMSKYLQEGDARGLVIEAHNCSSISANIGAVWLSRLATELRVAASKVQGKDLPPEIPQMVDRVINGVDLTLEYLEKCRIISRGPDGKWLMKKTPSVLTQSEEIPKDDMGKTRVLVVDDMPMTQFIVTTLLNKLHFACDTVSNGVEAITALKKTSYDLVLMDNYMDQMTGIEAVRQIREQEKTTGKHVPVIGLTSLVGNNSEEVVPLLIKAGMDDVIFKPVLRNSFLSRLEIWRPQLADAFTWTLELDTLLLDELVQSAPTTITQAIPRIIDISNKVSNLLVQALGEHHAPSQLVTPISELIELCSMLGASRLAEVAKILYQYVTTREVSETTAQRLVQIYAVVRASTVDSFNKFCRSRSLEVGSSPVENRSTAHLSPHSSTQLALPTPSPPLTLSDTTPAVRVLVADDQPLTRLVIKSMVAKVYPDVLIDMAENGEIAVAKADTTWYNLILMDIGMPKMDGYKASQLIRASEALRQQAPMSIVAITAGSVTKANDATAYQEAGMNELIHKPFNNAKLTTIFNKYIYEKEKPQLQSTPETHSSSNPPDTMSSFTNYPDEMILNSEILEMLRGLGILERTVETFEKHSRELLLRARSVDPGQLLKRSSIRQSIHALKGISLNSGASMLGRMCDDLERVVLECDKETVVKMLDMIEAGFGHVMKRFNEIQ